MSLTIVQFSREEADEILNRSEPSGVVVDGSQVTMKAYNTLHKLDRTFVGTPHYMGLCYFWSYEYRHYLRDASAHVRKQVHNTFLKSGLVVNEDSPEHESIIAGCLTHFIKSGFLRRLENE